MSKLPRWVSNAPKETGRPSSAFAVEGVAAARGGSRSGRAHGIDTGRAKLGWRLVHGQPAWRSQPFWRMVSQQPKFWRSSGVIRDSAEKCRGPSG